METLVRLPEVALSRLQIAWRSAEQMRLQYEALATVAIEAMGYDTTRQRVHLDLESGMITVQEDEDAAARAVD
jgi:hypothetical protein